MNYSFKTAEEMRVAAANWLLNNDINMVTCVGNELGQRFVDDFRLPVESEVLDETEIDEKGNIVLVFRNALRLPAAKTLSNKQMSFVYLRYVRALYDDFGNVYKYVTLGYVY